MVLRAASVWHSGRWWPDFYAPSGVKMRHFKRVYGATFGILRYIACATLRTFMDAMCVITWTHFAPECLSQMLQIKSTV